MIGNLHLKHALIFLSLFLSSVIQAQSIDRIENSPYPSSRRPDTLYVIDDTRLTPAQQFVVQSLQGLLATYKPKIYRLSDEGSFMWMSELTGRYGVHTDNTYLNDYIGLVRHFQDSISGYILCKMGGGSTNAAVSLSYTYNAITVPDSLEASFSFLPKVLDATGMNEEDVYAKYHDSLSKQILCYQKESNANFLGDYAIFSSAFQFYEPIANIFTQSVFRDMKGNPALFGWGDDEHELVSAASKNSMIVHAADYANNLSTLTNFNANFSQQQGSTNFDTLDPNVHTVCFVMTDGDNIQWLTHSFATSKNWYNSDERGSMPMGWTVSPALAELAPPILKYLYDNESNSVTGRDYFIAAPSGLGYLYPDLVPQMLNNADLMNKFLKKADLHIVNVIGNHRSEDLSAYTHCSNVDAVFYYMYSDYSGWKGKIMWDNGKPIIGGKFSFWGDKETPQTMADRINAEPKNQFMPEGYSLIPVHAWSHTVEDIHKCVERLDDNVRVVAPDDFVKLIQQNLTVELYPNYPNPVTDHTTISFQLKYPQQVTVQIIDGSGTLVKTVFDGVAEAGITKVDFHKDETMAVGTFTIVLITPSQTKSVNMVVAQ